MTASSNVSAAGSVAPCSPLFLPPKTHGRIGSSAIAISIRHGPAMLGWGRRITLGLRIITVDDFSTYHCKEAIVVTAAIRSCFGMYFCGLNCIFERRNQGGPVWVVRGKSLCYNQGILGTLHCRIGNHQRPGLQRFGRPELPGHSLPPLRSRPLHPAPIAVICSAKLPLRS